MPFVRVIFITGTDTGVGKSLITALLLRHLRDNGHSAFAIKPFCTGNRADAKLLHALQNGDLDLHEINPFYFSEPVAPLVAARKHRRPISLSQVLGHISNLQQNLANESQPATILIEGAGGLLVPLGKDYTWAKVIQKLRCEVILVSANRLGTINHTLLTHRVLQAADIQTLTVLLMDVLSPRHVTPDTRHNARILAEFLPSTPLLEIPFLGPNACSPKAVKKNAKKIKKVLARILA